MKLFLLTVLTLASLVLALVGFRYFRSWRSGAAGETNIALNPSFELGLANWTLQKATDVSVTFNATSNQPLQGAGVAELMITSPRLLAKDIVVLSDGINFLPGVEYTIDFAIRSEKPLEGSARILDGVNAMNSWSFTSTPTWSRSSVKFKPTQAIAAGNLALNLGNTMGKVWIDDVKVLQPIINTIVPSPTSGSSNNQLPTAGPTNTTAPTMPGMTHTLAPTGTPGSLGVEVDKSDTDDVINKFILDQVKAGRRNIAAGGAWWGLVANAHENQIWIVNRNIEIGRVYGSNANVQADIACVMPGVNGLGTSKNTLNKNPEMTLHMWPNNISANSHQDRRRVTPNTFVTYQVQGEGGGSQEKRTECHTEETVRDVATGRIPGEIVQANINHAIWFGAKTGPWGENDSANHNTITPIRDYMDSHGWYTDIEYVFNVLENPLELMGKTVSGNITLRTKVQKSKGTGSVHHRGIKIEQGYKDYWYAQTVSSPDASPLPQPFGDRGYYDYVVDTRKLNDGWHIISFHSHAIDKGGLTGHFGMQNAAEMKLPICVNNLGQGNCASGNPAPTTPPATTSIPTVQPTNPPVMSGTFGLLSNGTRDKFKWPFASNSPWNTSIGSGASYQDANIVRGAGTLFAIDEDIVVMKPTAPMIDVKYNGSGWTEGGDRCPAQGGTVQSVPVPASYWVGNTTQNHSASFLMPDGQTVKQNQPFTRCVAGGVATTLLAFGDQNIYQAGLYGSHGGSGLSALGGTIRLGEFSSGKISHVMKVNLLASQYYWSGCQARWPANRVDGYCGGGGTDAYRGSNPNFTPGALLALKPDFNVNGLRTIPGKILARAFIDYGAYVVDDKYIDAYAIVTEQGPDGRVANEFQSLYGFGIEQRQVALITTPWGLDIKDIFENLYIVTNNRADNVGGGGTPRVTLPPAIGN